MEDVELSLRLQRLERPAYLNLPVTVSARSWRGQSALRRAHLILRLVGAYMWRRERGENPVDVGAMYGAYYATRANRL